MAKITNCDLCGKEGAFHGVHQKRVEFPREFNGAKHGLVQISVIGGDARQTLPDVCDDCAATLAAAPAFDPNAKPAPKK